MELCHVALRVVKYVFDFERCDCAQHKNERASKVPCMMTLQRAMEQRSMVGILSDPDIQL